jgi:hypothetical protein
MWDWIKWAVVGLLGVVGVGPLISEMIKKWAERNGYLDDPSKGLHWLLSSLGGVADSPFFYPALAFLVGLVMGLWADRVVARVTENSSDEIKSIGYRFMELRDDIASRMGMVTVEWLQSIGDIGPQLQSAFLRAKKAGIWTPTRRAFELQDDGKFVVHYLSFVGQLLADGHIDEAKDFARSEKSRLDAS